MMQKVTMIVAHLFCHYVSLIYLQCCVLIFWGVKTALKVFGIAAELTNHSFPKNRWCFAKLNPKHILSHAIQLDRLGESPAHIDYGDLCIDRQYIRVAFRVMILSKYQQ
jgi:hypothetical protein